MQGESLLEKYEPKNLLENIVVFLVMIWKTFDVEKNCVTRGFIFLKDETVFWLTLLKLRNSYYRLFSIVALAEPIQNCSDFWYTGFFQYVHQLPLLTSNRIFYILRTHTA